MLAAGGGLLCGSAGRHVFEALAAGKKQQLLDWPHRLPTVAPPSPWLQGIYVPELIFGNLLTSSNYNDNEKKVGGAACFWRPANKRHELQPSWVPVDGCVACRCPCAGPAASSYTPHVAHLLALLRR